MWPFKRKTEPRVFTGNCLVWQHTGDGVYVGRCYHSTYNGRCHVHGDVRIYLDGWLVWPRDYDLEPNP